MLVTARRSKRFVKVHNDCKKKKNIGTLFYELINNSKHVLTLAPVSRDCGNLIKKKKKKKKRKRKKKTFRWKIREHVPILFVFVLHAYTFDYFQRIRNHSLKRTLVIFHRSVPILFRVVAGGKIQAKPC